MNGNTTNGNSNNINGSGIANIGFGLETERNVEVVITGMFESVEQARVRLLVLLDELVSFLFSFTLFTAQFLSTFNAHFLDLTTHFLLYFVFTERTTFRSL